MRITDMPVSKDSQASFARGRRARYAVVSSALLGAIVGATPHVGSMYWFSAVNALAMRACQALYPFGDRLAGHATLLCLLAPDILLLSLVGFALGRWLALRPGVAGASMCISYVGFPAVLDGSLYLGFQGNARPIVAQVVVLGLPILAGVLSLFAGYALRHRRAAQA